ncbi:HNH endonuclease [Actinomadura monticuli]|uniref:HNH endonuclease n=1 Tax=Actinomadura monticuli TaxID=3097367 RepID=A0ABV4Q9I9_9ACTN
MKSRLKNVEGDIVASDQMYVEAARSNSLHTLNPRQFSSDPEVTNPEMISLYKNGMVRRQGPGRPIYDEIILAARHGLCPLCGQRQVSTLDHHLPKSLFPHLVVNPHNLVPACSDCNKAKLDTAPSCSEDETLHPYFDDIENDLWLKAKVLENKPTALVFYVSPPEEWDDTMKERVKRHFRTFGLASLYAAQAAYELNNIKFHLEQLYHSNIANGAVLIRDHLRSQAASRHRVHINSWQSATYHALADSDWYCDGGFS